MNVPDFSFLENPLFFKIVLFFGVIALVGMTVTFWWLGNNLDSWVKIQCLPPSFNNTIFSNFTIKQ